MADKNWGECKGCKYFEIEPGARAGDRTMGLCIVHELETYRLRVSGASGCTLFEHGKVAHAEGASKAPPSVVHSH
ncbi:hypothetical protein ACYOEI_21205 [Singulisphaera rosea]